MITELVSRDVLSTKVDNLILMGFDFGLTDYPIFDEAYRTTLNNKILSHYKFYEIGFFNTNRFKHELNVRMGEIMERYNMLYRANVRTINPLYDFTRSKEVGFTSLTTSNQTNNSEGQGVYSDTATKALTQEDLDNGTYITSANLDNNQITNNFTGNGSGTTTETDNGVNQELANIVSNFQTKFNDVDEMIINELCDLFAMVYDIEVSE